MSPKSQPVVSKIVGQDRSPKVTALMIGCWRRDIDGIVCCLRWVKASWWDLSAVLRFPLSSSQSANHISCHYQSLTQPTHSEIRRPTSAPVPLNCSLSWFSRPPMLTNLCSMFSPFFVTIMSYRIFTSRLWWFCLLSAPLSLGARGPGNQQKHLEYIAGSGWMYPPLTCQ